MGAVESKEHRSLLSTPLFAEYKKEQKSIERKGQNDCL